MIFSCTYRCILLIANLLDVDLTGKTLRQLRLQLIVDRPLLRQAVPRSAEDDAGYLLRVHPRQRHRHAHLHTDDAAVHGHRQVLAEGHRVGPRIPELLIL